MVRRAGDLSLPDAPFDLDQARRDVEGLKQVRSLSERGASFGRSIDILALPATSNGLTWPGEAVIDARDETGGRDWCVLVEPAATAAVRTSLIADPFFPVFVVCFGGADGVEQSADGLHFDFVAGPQAPRPPFFYVSPRGSCFHAPGEKMRVTAGQFPQSLVPASQPWRISVTATRSTPRRQWQSTDVPIGAGATVIVRPPKFSTAFSGVGAPVGILATQMDETQTAIVPAFALSVPGQRIPLARCCTYLALSNGTGGTLTHSIQWELFL